MSKGRTKKRRDSGLRFQRGVPVHASAPGHTPKLRGEKGAHTATLPSFSPFGGLLGGPRRHRWIRLEILEVQGVAVSGY
eukprot:4047949-Pyramimonas_sp.AAC.1